MLAFIDESGTPHPNDAASVSTLLALCMREREHRKVNRALYSIQRSVLGDQPRRELKATQLLRRREFERRPAERELVEAIFDMIGRIETTLFCIIMPRPMRAPDLPVDTAAPARLPVAKNQRVG